MYIECQNQQVNQGRITYLLRPRSLHGAIKECNIFYRFVGQFVNNFYQIRLDIVYQNYYNSKIRGMFMEDIA